MLLWSSGQTHGPLKAEPPVQIRTGACWQAVQWSGRAADFGESAGSSPALPIWVCNSGGRESANSEVVEGSSPLAPILDAWSKGRTPPSQGGSRGSSPRASTWTAHTVQRRGAIAERISTSLIHRCASSRVWSGRRPSKAEAQVQHQPRSVGLEPMRTGTRLLTAR